MLAYSLFQKGSESSINCSAPYTQYVLSHASLLLAVTSGTKHGLRVRSSRAKHFKEKMRVYLIRFKLSVIFKV